MHKNNSINKKIAVAVLLILLPWSRVSTAAEIYGTVVAVTDGDTLKVLTKDLVEIKVRLAGIDAPEKKQAFGAKSKENLSNLVYMKNVELHCSKQDRYKRSICVIFLNKQDINIMQIKSGLAWWYRKYAKEQSSEDRSRYEETENIAKEGRVGLWRDERPIPPWDFRRRR